MVKVELPLVKYNAPPSPVPFPLENVNPFISTVMAEVDSKSLKVPESLLMVLPDACALKVISLKRLGSTVVKSTVPVSEKLMICGPATPFAVVMAVLKVPGPEFAKLDTVYVAACDWVIIPIKAEISKVDSNFLIIAFLFVWCKSIKTISNTPIKLNN